MKLIDSKDQSRGRVSGNERGATMIEYSLMVALLGVACIAAVTALRDNIDATYQDAEDALTGAIDPAEPGF